MQPLIYDVAVSIDGFIAGLVVGNPSLGDKPDVSRFAHKGAIVEDYKERLASYTVALMGRATYEFGYAFGLPPGANPYPTMRSFVISQSIDLPLSCDVEVIQGDTLRHIKALKAEASGPLYLCGGGILAGSLLAGGLIDRLRLKRAPIVLGTGVPLFSGVTNAPTFTLMAEKSYDNGAVFQEYMLD